MKKNRRSGSKGNVNIPAAPVVKAMEIPAVAPSEEMILQFGDHEVAAADISEKAKQDYKNSENDAELKEIRIYVKPEDNKAYYVVNGEFEGNVDLT